MPGPLSDACLVTSLMLESFTKHFNVAFAFGNQDFLESPLFFSFIIHILQQNHINVKEHYLKEIFYEGIFIFVKKIY